MNEYTMSLSKEVCDKINKDLYMLLITISPGIRIINVEAYTRVTGHEPCISSVFMLPGIGSYSTIIKGKKLHVHNSTLQSYGNIAFGSISEQYVHHINKK